MEKHAADWKYVTYLVFDAPQRSQKGLQYEQRVAWLEANIQPQSETTYAAVVGVCKCTGRDHLNKLLKQVRQSSDSDALRSQMKFQAVHASLRGRSRPAAVLTAHLHCAPLRVLIIFCSGPREGRRGHHAAAAEVALRELPLAHAAEG